MVNASPYGSGSLNTSGGQYKEGASVYLYAYDHDGLYFTEWVDDEGNTLTKSRSCYYTMPKRDAVVTAVYKYSPANPSLPDVPETDVPTYSLKLDTKPAGAGSFNTNSVSLKEKEEIHLYAYSNTYFYFKQWEDAEGNVISTAQNFYYTMPAKDTQLYAIYTYNPSNPANPGKNHYDSFTGEVIIDDFKKGSLSSAIYDVTKGNTSNITSIIVSGIINSNDFSIANNYSTCTIVDLSRTSGVTTVPSYCYDGNTHLNRLSLPACITNIEYRAFRNATALTELTCHSTVPPTLGSYVFSGVTPGLIVYVPASSVELYEQAAGWKEYEADGTIVIMPIQSQVSSLEVNLPKECADGRYKNMPLELLNVKTGQKYKYVVTDRVNYTFNNLVNGTRYVATLKNLSGQVLAKTDTISINEENVSVTFDLASMKQLRSVKASVLTKEGTDVSSNCVITWYDANGTFLSQSKSLEGQVSETKVRCAVSLSQALAMEYVLPADSLYEVVEGENNVIFTLAPLPKMQLSGRILDVTTQQAISNANITVSQTLNGKYSKSLSGKTDNKGAYTMTVFAAPSSVTFAANDYVSQTIELADSVFTKEESTLADIKLKPITGATITTNFTYATSVAAGVEPDVQNYYSDYNNVAYSIYNVTAQKEIRQFNVQYPNIVLLEEVNEDDSLSITATSKNGAFMDITVGGHVNEALRMDVTIPVVQLGGIDATFTTTENSKVLGILYDSKGAFVSKYNYGSSTLSIRELKDGEYTLVTMGASDFFGSIYNLEKFSEAGLQQNIDYLVNKVTVKSGIISPLKNVLVPFFDESKFYYTGDNTSFTVNKTSIVAGNYLTLTAKVDFKEVYKSSISDVKVSVELPEGTSMVDNSVMVGSDIAFYELNGNTLTIPLDNNVSSDRVRFCVIPTKSGSFAPNASVEFKLGDKKVSQPMGSASYAVKDIAISVPSETNTPEITVTGVASGKAEVVVYANGDVLGTTTALANGWWSLTTELDNPYNLQEFDIYADITSSTGLSVKTETQKCLYNKDVIVAEKVTMLYYNPEMGDYSIEFDLINATVTPSSFYFFPYKSWPNWQGSGTEPKDFTFIVDLSNNDTTIVKDVTVGVYTKQNNWVYLDASYNKNKDRWIATSQFEESNLPTGVKVDFDADFPSVFDDRIISNLKEEIFSTVQSGVQLISEFDLIDENEYTAEQYEEKLMSIIGEDVNNSDALTYEEISTWSDEELEERLNALEDPDYSIEDLNEEISEIRELFCSETDYTCDTGNGIKVKSCSCLGLTAEHLLELGFDEYTTTTGKIYVLRSETKNVFVDFSQDLYIEISKDSESYARVLAKASKLEEGLDQFNAIVDNINSCYQPIADAYEKTEKLLGDFYLKFEKMLSSANAELPKAKTRYNMKLVKLERLEKELANMATHDGNYYLKQLQVDSYKQEVKAAKSILDKLNAKKVFASMAVKLSKPLPGVFKKNIPLIKYANIIYDGVKVVRTFQQLYQSVPDPCENEQAKADNCKSLCVAAAVFCEGVVLAKAGASALLDFATIGQLAAAAETGGVSALTAIATVIVNIGGNLALDFVSQKEIDRRSNQIKRIKDKLKCKDDKCPKCHKKPCECEKPCPTCGQKPCICCDYCHSYPCKCQRCNRCGKRVQECSCKPCKKCGHIDCICEPEPKVDPIHDPSGFVYEGVFSNRLEGVTAICYYKEIIEDMYGDLHENIVKWNAEEYAQENPLFTDATGHYRWDVPQGLWQVRFEKEGYVPTQSEWLPVPPPQMDVNIAMVQNAQPEVVSARAYEDGVEIEFSKYMNIESLNSENVYLKVVNGDEESLITDAEIQMLNKEVTIEGSTTEYASKMKLATDQLGYYDEAYIIISTGVNSYAGIPMAQTFEQKLDVEKKVRELLVDAEFNVEYDGQKEVLIAAIPADAAVGKKLSVVSASDMIATTDVQEVTFDADGQATFTVNGELYGATAINYSLMDADLKATSLVNVVDPVKLEAVKAPMASRISGTAVYRGQTVTLSCESEGATIYYTTDGSCPCDEKSRLKYERPIAINDAMTLKFMAVGTNYDESDVIECTYSIRQSDVKLNLAKGWNWNSHDVASPIDISELSGIASVVLTQTDEVIDDPVLGFIGTLTSVDASETMKIKAKASTLKAFTGEQYNPALSPISLQSGWNWLGYPINQTMTVADALSYMDAEEGDCISNLDGGFATYTDGSWVGSLETMTPGAGYLYKSATSKSFIYNDVPTVQNARALYGHRLELKSVPWSINKHNYPNMMPMIAQLCYADGEVADSIYYVAAFAGDECRGIGKYADGAIYLSIYGDKATELTFKACNEDTGYVHDFAETITFAPDVVGTPAAPFMLKFGGEPNSINTISTCNGIDGIYNLQGVKVNSISGSGIYIIKSTDKHGNSVIQKSYVK